MNHQLNVFRQPDGNTVTVADAVHAEIDKIRTELPKGVDLQPFYDQSEIVGDSIASVRDAVILGLVLASLIMVLFLRDWGTSLVAGLVIVAVAWPHRRASVPRRRSIRLAGRRATRVVP